MGKLFNSLNFGVFWFEMKPVWHMGGFLIVEAIIGWIFAY